VIAADGASVARTSKRFYDRAMRTLGLVTLFAVACHDEDAEKMRRLEERVAALERSVPHGVPLPSAGTTNWWCTAPVLSRVNHDDLGACFSTREECATMAGSLGQTCILADVPFCYDVGEDNGLGTGRSCFFDIASCNDSRGAQPIGTRRPYAPPARSGCYRATSGPKR
jgi:hypothetical protein